MKEKEEDSSYGGTMFILKTCTLKTCPQCDVDQYNDFRQSN